MSKEKFPEIKITYKGRTRKVTTTGLVIGNDPDIGITIVDKWKRNEYLLCSNGPATKLGRDYYKNRPGLWEKEYFTMNLLIKRGHIDFTDQSEWAGIISGDAPSSENCPFNQ